MIKKTLLKLAEKIPLVSKIRYQHNTLQNKLLRQYYQLLPIYEKTIFFEAYMAHSYACSPKAIYEYMLDNPQYDDYSFVWSFRNPTKYKHLLSNERTSLVAYGTPQYYQALARAKYWIVNGWIPTLMNKRPAQVMVQTWHGTPLKRLRNDLILNTKHATLTFEKQVALNRADAARYDYFISPSRFASNKFTSAFSLNELGKKNIIIETGYPRNDFLFRYKKADVEAAKQKFSIPASKKIILYAPTWRDDQHEAEKGFTYSLQIDFDLLREKFFDEYVVLFRAHYNIASSFNFEGYEGFIYDVSGVDDVNELYIISDVLVTDYSSVFFDYANLRRPIIFFMYDLDYYEKELRGFYLDVDELPGPIAKTNSQLVNRLSNLSTVSSEYRDSYERFRDRYNYLDDAYASKRVVEMVFK